MGQVHRIVTSADGDYITIEEDAPGEDSALCTVAVFDEYDNQHGSIYLAPETCAEFAKLMAEVAERMRVPADVVNAGKRGTAYEIPRDRRPPAPPPPPPKRREV